MRVRFARTRVPIYAAAAFVAAVAAFVPTPYSLIMPGRAVDLRQVVSVAGHGVPRIPFYLTDVRFAARVTPLELMNGFVPGVQVVWTKDVLPQGVTAVEYDSVEREAMSESQSIAAVVAEREAGLLVPVPRARVMIVYFSPISHARGALHPLDMIVSIDRHPIASNADVVHALASVKPGGPVQMTIVRRGDFQQVTVPTIAYGSRAALGAYLTTIYERPHIPVAVAYHLPNVSGSSGGLMFALEIYRSLRHTETPPGERVAGTGTIAYDGTVGPIEGAPQKVIAARNAGATVFLVPVENYREIAGTRNIRIVPVANFTQALAAIGVRSRTN